MNSDGVSAALIEVVAGGLILLIGIEMHKDKKLTEVCLSNGYSEQRRTSDDGYCIKRGKDGETIVRAAAEIDRNTK